MKLIIMRHGQAALSGDDRVLTSQGIRETMEVATAINNKYVITKAYASPLTRAQQTAQLVLNQSNSKVIIETLPELVPNGDPLTVRALIDSCCLNNEVVLLLSHIPLVSELCYEFTSHHEFGPDFATSSALLLDYNGQIATPEHFFAPQGEHWY
ncbi:MAG: histidine phosphatase family protein [Succinatimonas sp.]|nr:histidine phosphatase family protein [Succinatimonas sp.]